MIALIKKFINNGLTEALDTKIDRVEVDTQSIETKVDAVDTVVDNINTNVGSNADSASATGSVHAKLKDLKASSVIKSIQRGSATFGDTTSQNITISSVNTSKSVVNFLGHSPSGINAGYSVFNSVLLRLTSSTNLNMFRPSSQTNDTGNVSWEVIEYE